MNPRPDPESPFGQVAPGNGGALPGLVRGALEGDGSCWRALVERLGPLVMSSCRGQGLSQAELDDVFQETWLSMHAHLRFLRDPEALPKWVAITARRHAWAVVRRSRHRRDVETRVAIEAEESDEDSSLPLERSDLQQRVWQAMEQLPERCQVMIRALHFSPEPPSYQELAETLGMPPGSLGPTRQRCLERLARLLDKLDRELNG